METVRNVNEVFKVAEITVSYIPKIRASQRPMVSTSKDVYECFASHWDNTRIEMLEQFKIMLLNRAQKVLGIFEVSTGGIVGTVADPKVIFSTALKGNATSIILAHNHPSGNLRPSEADKQLTAKLCKAGSFLDIAVLDHIILTAEGYFSFSDEGLI
ncbi:JAB domain-containing protein [Daejeonella sp. JGW-45]|uniref:JAB domain-containing protein n=1 Tax=Daejeonella sp. JGW-45 TaxID=3034148 RepID=UPI0023EB26F0|nr:JAB domain-containing protein [Daejeonella sp. JGW-45]